MIGYLRSKRALIADRNRYRALAIKQIDELADKDEQLAEYDRALTALRESFDRTRIGRELADVVREETQMKRRLDV